MDPGSLCGAAGWLVQDPSPPRKQTAGMAPVGMQYHKFTLPTSVAWHVGITDQHGKNN